jgi:ATP-dependent Clp protease ATP-binding subunit ClpA
MRNHSHEGRPEPWRPHLQRLHEDFSHHIRGQPEVLSRLVEALLRRELNAVPQRGARGAFFFAGPPGVGKTETAITAADLLFGPGRLVRFDCSEIKTLEAFASLLGNRTGDRGRFGQAHTQCPDGVWLFDEIEKSHPEFVHLFLQMTDAARITLANGETLDLSRIYLFVTSNLGSAEIQGRLHLPFASLERHVTRCVRRRLLPENLNRFGPPYVFRPFSPEVKAEILEQKLDVFIDWQKEQGRHITVDLKVLRFLQQRGFSDEAGARSLVRLIDELAGNPIAQQCLAGRNGSGRLEIAPGGNHLCLVV